MKPERRTAGIIHQEIRPSMHKSGLIILKCQWKRETRQEWQWTAGSKPRAQVNGCDISMARSTGQSARWINDQEPIGPRQGHANITRQGNESSWEQKPKTDQPKAARQERRFAGGVAYLSGANWRLHVGQFHWENLWFYWKFFATPRKNCNWFSECRIWYVVDSDRAKCLMKNNPCNAEAP